MKLKDLAIVIKRARLKNKYSQKQVADFVGISKSGYSQIESGKKKPSVTIFIMICCMLDICFEEFLDMPEDDAYVDPDREDAESDEEEENDGWFR